MKLNQLAPFLLTKLKRSLIGIVVALLLLATSMTGLAVQSVQAADPVTGAITWAQNQIGKTDWDLYCLRFVRLAYQNGAGVDIGSSESAINYWNTHANLQHPNDTNAPPGALVFWGPTPYGTVTYVNPDGHVALSIGGSSVISTKERGIVGVHTLTISDRNQYQYLGWMMPPGVSVQSSYALK